ncbi:MAG TPA: Mur ligase family protein [Patescibacteria group bacterium]|nr:Mur ligase family protein [Patescibacteria group bacterium]
MKPLLKIILKYYLKYITKLVLIIHRPFIIAVAGSTNKTFVKDEVAKVIRKKGYFVRANQNNFNTEIGLPLAVLDLPSGYNSYRKWLPTLYQSLFCLFRLNYPKYLILELGASNRGDMRHLLSIINPKISIITDITQRYLENFSDMNDLTEEYKILAKKTVARGQIIINCDNIKLKKIYDSIRGKKQSFGQTAGCDWRIENCGRTEKGEKFQLEHKGNIIEKEIDYFGEHHIYAAVSSLIINEIV